MIPQYVNPTLKIEIKDTYSEKEIETIVAFWNLLCLSKGRGGVLKAPYTTGGKWVRSPKRLYRPDNFVGGDSHALFPYLKKAYEDFHGVFDYMLLQPCIDIYLDESESIRRMGREQKVVFLNGVASHICSYSKGTQFKKFASDEEVLAFAQEAFNALRSAAGENSWFDQLVRVDVMWNDDEQRMVVNEVETIEAEYKSKGLGKSLTLDGRIFDSLHMYWYNELKICVADKIESLVCK